MKIANAFKQIIRFGLTRSQEQKDSLTIKNLWPMVDALEATYYAQSPGSLAEAGARLLRVAAKLQKKSASPEIKELGLNLAERVRNKDSSSYDEAHALAVVHYTAKLESQKKCPHWNCDGRYFHEQYSGLEAYSFGFNGSEFFRTL